VKVTVASKVGRTVADKQVNDCHCILFLDVESNLMMRNLNLESLSKSQEVFFGCNVIKWNLGEYSIRYEDLPNIHLVIYDQNVKFHSPFILNLQNVKDRSQSDDDVRNVVLKCLHGDKKNSSFILKDASRPYESIHGDDRTCHSYSNGYKILSEATKTDDSNIVMNFVLSIAKGKCSSCSLAAVVDDNHEVDIDVDGKCMLHMNCHGANDSTEDDMVRKKATVSTTHSSQGGSCFSSSEWMEKLDTSRRMDCMQILNAFSKFLLKIAQFFLSSQMWIPWVYLSRYSGECFPGESFRTDNLLF